MKPSFRQDARDPKKSARKSRRKGTGYIVSVGRATWMPADEGRPPEAPVLLVPLTVENRGREGRSVALKRNGDIQSNLALLHFLQDQFGVSIAAEALIEIFQGDDENET